MIGKGVGVLALAAVLGFVTYYETSFLQLQQLSAAAPAAVGGTLAQISTGGSGSAAPAPSGGTRVDGTCIGGQTIVLNVDAKGVHVASDSCDAKPNTCKVTVNAPNNETATVDYCCNPSPTAAIGDCQCVAPGTNCSSIPGKNLTLSSVAQCKRNNTPLKTSPTGMVRSESQLAATLAIGILCKSGEVAGIINKKYSSTAPTNVSTPAPPASPTNVTTPPPPVAQAPAPPRTELGKALQGDTRVAGPTAPAASPSSAYDGIRDAGRQGSAAPGTALPGQTQTTLNPATTRPDAIYRPPGYVPPATTPLTTTSRPGSFTQGLPRAQTTFGNTGVSAGSRVGSGTRVAGAFLSGFASLIGGLFSVPTNSVVNYVQSFVGAAPEQAPTTTAPPQTSPQGQVIVVVPYPMPTSSSSYRLPPPPATADIYAQIRALANEENGVSGAPVPAGVQEDRISAAFTQPEESGQPAATPAGNTNANVRADAAVTARPRIDSGPDGEISTGSAGVRTDDATSTHATSTSYREPVVVEVGIPVDITDPASYESIIAYLSGDWANVKRTALQNKLALAQAESQQESIRAQIEALQDARAADVCDDSCAASLTVLRNEIPVLQSRVEALQTAVEKDAQPRPASPPPTVAQINRIVESLADPGYQASIPRSASAPPAAVSVSEQEALPEVPQTKSEAIVTRVVQSVWNFLKSWFLPPATEASQPRPSCSLFASLFGKCK